MLNYLMNIKRLQAILEKKNPEVNLTVPYLALGLSGEVGEVSNILKRTLNDAWGKDAYKELLEDELGDVFWYLHMLIDKLDLNVVTILEKNVDKISKRVELREYGSSPCKPSLPNIQEIILENKREEIINIIKNSISESNT